MALCILMSTIPLKSARIGTSNSCSCSSGSSKSRSRPKNPGHLICSLQARTFDAAIKHSELPHHNVFCREILLAVLVGFSDASFDSELPPHHSDNVICRAIILAVPVSVLMLQSTLRVLTFRAMSFVPQFCLQSLQTFLMLQS